MIKALSLFLLVPALALAQSTPTDFKSVVKLFIDIINSLLPILVGLSLLVFLFGLVKFIYQSGDSKSHEAGRNLMVYGIIGLFIMVSFMGIIAVFYKDLGFTATKPLGFPSVLLPSSH